MTKINFNNIAAFLLFFSCQFALAQKAETRYDKQLDSLLANWGQEGSFTIRGKIKNCSAKFIEFSISNYIESTQHSLIIKEDGTFEQKFPILNTQSIYLNLNEDILVFTASEKDIINIEGDEKDLNRSIEFNSSQPIRNLILQTELNLYHKFNQAYLSLRRDFVKNKKTYSDGQKFDLINNQYNDVIKLILNREKANQNQGDLHKAGFGNLIANEYFKYANLLRQENLLHMPLTISLDEDFKLPTFDRVINNQKRTFSKYPILDQKNAHKTLNEIYMVSVSNYREFIYNYLKWLWQFNNYSKIINYKSGDEIPKVNYTEQLYYQGKASFGGFLGSSLVGDWFITKTIIEGFNRDDFQHVEMVYNKFLSECKTNYFKKTLAKNYEAQKKLMPGLIAPEFELKNELGKLVKLSDFKGKVIYIDFWGVYCAPCLRQMEEFTPKLQTKYKDVVFVNICVDANEQEWKEGIKKYDVRGINLIAEGWGKNPVCIDYNVTSIPRYIIINKDGTILNNNARMPSEILELESGNDLEKALKKP